MNEIDMHRRGQPEYNQPNVNRLAGQAKRELRLAVSSRADQARTRDGGDIGGKSSLNHPGRVDRLARGELAGDEELDIIKPVRQPDFPGLNLEPQEAGPWGRVSVSTASSSLGCTPVTGAEAAKELVLTGTGAIP